MLKILFLVTQSEMGGAQRYVFEIARGLDRQKYDILAAAGEGDGELFGKLAGAGIRTCKLQKMRRTPWLVSSAVWEISGLLKKENPDILFLCSTTAGLLGSLARFFCRSRASVIYRIGGWAFRDPRAFWKNWLILLAEKLTAPLKDLIIVNSEKDRQLALKYKIVPEKKLAKIYNGIDVNSLNFLSRDEARKQLLKSDFNNPTKSVLVGCVANFYKTKGLAYLIEAAHKMLEVGPPIFKFLIIGEGGERPRLEGLIKKYGLGDKVILVGRIPDAYSYLKAFDVFVLPSLKEGFPWIILEAMAAEVPIVATNVGAIPEILSQESLVAPADAPALAKKIGWMLEHPTKPVFKKEFTSQTMLQETWRALARFQPSAAAATR